MHLWLANLDAETTNVFATAFTLSGRKRNYRVSTERFLAALPDGRKEQMARLCAAAKNDIKMSVSSGDLPPVELPADWQEKVCFSTCVECTLLKCAPGTNLVGFLKLLCATAVRLHCVAERNMPIDAYLASDDEPRPPSPISFAPAHKPERWLSHPAATFAVDELLDGDVLLHLLSKASTVEALRNCKAVCTAWRTAARRTLCDVEWLQEQQVSLHDLLKKGRPSPQLALALAAKRPSCVHERDGEGLLPLQHAAAYRMDDALLSALRQASAAHVPGMSAAWANSAEACSIKSHLRPVRTRVTRGPIAA